jgi:hypothetical protein
VQGDPRAPGGLFGLGESLNSRYFRNVLADFPAADVPLTPEGAARLKQNLQPTTFNPILNCLPDGVPHGDLLPEPFKIVHSNGVIVFLYEVETTFRQVFMDSRKLPVDPSPAWQGLLGGPVGGPTRLSWTRSASTTVAGWTPGNPPQRRNARRGTLPPPRLRPHGLEDHHHRPQDVHSADSPSAWSSI